MYLLKFEEKIRFTTKFAQKRISRFEFKISISQSWMPISVENRAFPKFFRPDLPSLMLMILNGLDYLLIFVKIVKS